MSLIVKAGKLGKKIIKSVLPEEKKYISYTRRIERVKTGERICAMTFDDGPFALACTPDVAQGNTLTDHLLDVLKKYDAKGTFDVIGYTGDNYPDSAGKLGTASWGGITYDHYPDINLDVHAGALNCPEHILRMINEGHQITNHGYRHIIFGAKPFVYGKRAYLGSLSAVLSDLQKLHSLMSEKYGYEMTMSRPPHYVDKIGDGFTSYDAYDLMGYQYLAASFDGKGWLPSTLSDERAAYRAEVDAMVLPVKSALEQNEDFFCGQIIFQKDGYNMAKRTPVADGLQRQLELLSRHGYRVVTVQELMRECPFADVDKSNPLFEKLCKMSSSRAIAYSDNTLRLDKDMTIGELAMLLCPKENMVSYVRNLMADNKHEHKYNIALKYCKEAGLIPQKAKADERVTELPAQYFSKTNVKTRGEILDAYKL